MKNVLSILIAFLTLVVVTVLLLATAYALGLWPIDLKAPTPPHNRYSLLPGIAISAGVLIAILTYIREANKVERERTRQRSEVLLERSTIELNRTVELLADRNNSRILWIRAARALERARNLGSLIKDDDYKLAYKLETERARDDLYDVLSLPSEDGSIRRGLPPQFFYGLPDWEAQRTLDEAAIAASSYVNTYAITIDQNPPESSFSPLSRDSVAAIYRFLEYPDDWEDPLVSAGDWGSDWEREHGIAAGAKRYADHSRGIHVVGGQIHRLGQERAG